MRTKYKPWAKPYLEAHPEVQISKECYKDIKDVDLEIGSGKGLFLVGMATKFPNRNFVGIEKNVTCSGFTAKKLVESELGNVKLIDDDAANVISEINDKSINNILLNFSDPWPKRRHFKRRLTSEKFLSAYHRILKDDGMIFFKTDNVDLFEYSLITFQENNFIIIDVQRDYKGDDDFDHITEYEMAFREEGTPINRVKLKKNG